MDIELIVLNTFACVGEDERKCKPSRGHDGLLLVASVRHGNNLERRNLATGGLATLYKGPLIEQKVRTDVIE